MKTYFTQHRFIFYLWVDLLLLNCSYLVSSRLNWSNSDAFDYQNFLNIFLISNLLWVVCVNLFQIYVPSSKSQNSQGRFWRLLMTSTVHLVCLEVFIYVSGSSINANENWVFTGYQVFIIASFIIHFVVAATLWLLRRSRLMVRRYVIVGDESLNDLIKSSNERQYAFDYSYCGSFKFESVGAQLERFENFIETEKPDYIYCALSETNNNEIKAVIKLAERKNTHVRLVPDYPRLLSEKLDIETADDFPIINVQTKILTNPDDQFIKRAFDVLFSIVVMIMGLPIFLLVMIAVKLSSKGDVFFLQERTGRWGKKFKIIKFRTMYSDAHKYGLQHSLGALDPRITTVGRFLRRTRLDELPQFLNVLKGEMSVVGPRPLHKYDVDMLMDEASHSFQKILTIRPGITSIGQIKVGYASNMSENLLRLKYDMLYLNTYSLTTDIYLIFLTIQVILLGKGR
ncbi:exopolysaccharide biosynthesis polyprenyl glycosylphosphotransferase [Dyadobacter sp. LJ53]|uniref:exopolysaccharide biosynthesis polyprenyl glycosylphosphotransferase n=1 Tax=Dyadobacter chenwenxiniae TaxID=2906456 RepID=UPI001F2C123C|nr:exopolysaccharide biosynthesis polyprenyl glycosylphosphotransferase [Dyadobacter chenwenxiniae]MCF0048480.1 exopolysaccharide biosynthesis polyprenyl glycosylphosphotransferase [Dyadobacter chenwenxiniae]